MRRKVHFSAFMLQLSYMFMYATGFRITNQLLFTCWLIFYFTFCFWYFYVRRYIMMFWNSRDKKKMKKTPIIIETKPSGIGFSVIIIQLMVGNPRQVSQTLTGSGQSLWKSLFSWTFFSSDSTNEKAKLTIFYIFCTNRNIPSLIISTDEAILRLALFLHERVKKPTVLGHEREKHYELSLYQTSKAYERKAEGFRHCFF